jgi:hypothetical protein
LLSVSKQNILENLSKDDEIAHFFPLCSSLIFNDFLLHLFYLQVVNAGRIDVDIPHIQSHLESFTKNGKIVVRLFFVKSGEKIVDGLSFRSPPLADLPEYSDVFTGA